MWRSIKRRLDHIRYHSASRPVNRWSRAIDLAFIAAFLLSLPAALIADWTQYTDRSTFDVPGIFSQSTREGIQAWLINPQGARSTNARGSAPLGQGDETIIGNFNLSASERLRGWPLVTTVEGLPPRLHIDIIRETRPRTDVPRDAGDPLQLAIERALNDDQRFDVLAAWNARASTTSPLWWAWFPVVGAWWLMLFVSAAVVIQFLRLGSFWLTRRRLRRAYERRHAGKCAKCGYDMTGLEFNERCPECGAQVW
jgi:hypothetical protein